MKNIWEENDLNYLVAGGSGFIGNFLCEELLKLRHTVICADKLIMGDKNIQYILENPEYKERCIFYKYELSDPVAVRSLFTEHHIDAVYHLAANSDIQKGGRLPDIDFRDTFLTTRVLLESMRESGCKNLFFASTSAIYGEKGDKLLTETTGDLRPVSYYGGYKLASEALISSYVSMADINAVIFRFPNVIGPRLTHGVIYDFIKKLKNDPKHLEILGNGTQCKPYIYVSDLVEAIILLTKDFLMESRESQESKDESGSNEKQGGGTEEIYNLSIEGEGTTVTRIAEIVCEEMGLRDVRFDYTGGDRGWKGDVPKFSYDISKVLGTGWKPNHSSDEAVRQSVRDALK